MSSVKMRYLGETDYEEKSATTAIHAQVAQIEAKLKTPIDVFRLPAEDETLLRQFYRNPPKLTKTREIKFKVAGVPYRTFPKDVNGTFSNHPTIGHHMFVYMGKNSYCGDPEYICGRVAEDYITPLLSFRTQLGHYPLYEIVDDEEKKEFYSTPIKESFFSPKHRESKVRFETTVETGELIEAESTPEPDSESEFEEVEVNRDGTPVVPESSTEEESEPPKNKKTRHRKKKW